MNFLFLLLSIFVLPTTVFCYNYLLYNPISGFSHVKHMSKIADVLANSGHNVTLFQPFHIPMSNLKGLVKNPNVEIINYYPDHIEANQMVADDRSMSHLWDANEQLGLFWLPAIFVKQWEPTCRKYLLDKNLHEELRSRKFDAAVVEIFEISGLYLTHILQIPATIASLSMIRLPSAGQMFGQGSLIGYFPYNTEYNTDLGFLGRMNSVANVLSGSVFYHLLMNQQYNLYRDILKDEYSDLPYWKDAITKSPVYITNANPYLDFAIPSTSNIIPVGGFTIDLEKKAPAVPEDYISVLNERNYTVFVSFGSIARSEQMPENFKNGLIGMFRKMPDVTFIWKYENATDEELLRILPSNVHLKHWVPQHALLADDRVSLFVTHGGLGSTMEVAYSGKPAIVIPLFGDQPMNSLMLARHRGAIVYNKFDLPNSEKLASTVREILSNPSYKTKASELNNVLRNQPINPKEILLKHMEFAVKFPDFKSQMPEILSAGLIGYYYLDVILFFIILSIVNVYLIFKVFRAVLKKFKISMKMKSD